MIEASRSRHERLQAALNLSVVVRHWAVTAAIVVSTAASAAHLL